MPTLPTLLALRPAQPWLALLMVLMLSACSTPPPASTSATVPTLPAVPTAKVPPPDLSAPLPLPLPWEQALQGLSNALLRELQASGALAAHGRLPEPGGWVIDPFVHAATREQSDATRQMTRWVTDALRSHQLLSPQPGVGLPANPGDRWLLIGGLFPSPERSRSPAFAMRGVWQLCAAVVDLASAKVIAQARVLAERVEASTEPSSFFRDAPLRFNDPADPQLDRACSPSGTTIEVPASYRARLPAMPVIQQAIEAYEAGTTMSALQGFEQALQVPSGHQLRSYTGRYLAWMKLGLRRRSLQSFEELVDLALDRGDFVLQEFHRPGGTAFQAQVGAVLQANDRLDAIARRLVQRLVCTEITVISGGRDVNLQDHRLARVRAQSVLDRLADSHPVLLRRLRSNAPHHDQAGYMLPTTASVPARGEPVAVRFRTIPCY